jgi:tetratricopeptide (TPR) repeat protein
MAIFTKELLHLNRKMKIVLLVIVIISLATLFFLWRDMSYKSLGQNAAYKAPMNIYTEAEKLMIRGKFDRALKRYEEAERMLRQIPNVDLSDDFYYGIVNNAIGTVYLRIGIYGEGNNDNKIKSRADLARDKSSIRKSQAYFDVSINAYQKWLKLNRPGPEKIAALMKNREGVAEDKIQLKPFERYERALSISLTNRGMALRYLGDIDGATACYDQALSLWADNKTAAANLKSMREVLEDESKNEQKMLDSQTAN